MSLISFCKNSKYLLAVKALSKIISSTILVSIRPKQTVKSNHLHPFIRFKVYLQMIHIEVFFFENSFLTFFISCSITLTETFLLISTETETFIPVFSSMMNLLMRSSFLQL